MNWLPFLRTTLATFALLSGLVYAFIVLVDPYQNIPFSLPIERAPISTNQRFAYPALARSPRFSSVVIGSSTMRLLDPENLDRLTGESFANLAMNSATAYEQVQILDLFLRRHADANTVILGIDDSWCNRGSAYEKYTFRAFPEWMYDDNRWNDLLYMFNDKALENAVRMLEYVAGSRTAKYEPNGYRDFTLDFGLYDPATAHKRLYPQGAPPIAQASNIAPVLGFADWQYASHGLLDELFDKVPDATTLIAVFVPMHDYYLLRAEALYSECKARVLEIAHRHHVVIMDYMIHSSITRNDENYWDPLHFRNAVAREIESDIAKVLKGSSRRDRNYLLH